ncbi:glycosyltransferase family 2 protein [Aliiglaciecola lipolytica]|uniref:Bactoprenol glucosyl transferase homolog from prophage CPS-53 n=1 Tax=Aliiglaciecola lipolytica E3 TaxID=1127673 RepID=K6YJV5_9ALTE|nr:glycosyltransferase family 2 protein [Aliiglaciecola lipolytica]GAC16883.1 bactoprenol glucosyl transferase homolog from prophage CPS-53 [Aliiglaciecola lipolytica E3]
MKHRLLNTKRLSILIPVYNESCVIDDFLKRLESAVEALTCEIELVFVDDGSVDDTCQIIDNYGLFTTERKIIKFSRNFGKEAALSAGLKATSGDAVILIDADLQDPPELIENMLSMWLKGADVVNMCRTKREGESWFKKFSAKCFYKLLNRLSDIPIPENVGDFRLISRQVVDVINAMPEKNLYMKGILSWPGFSTVTLHFERDARYCGESKWPFFKLLNLALEGITSFSTKPLQVATWLGVLVASSAFIYGGIIVAKTLLFGESVAGFPSLMVTMLALGGFQLLTVGIMGTYIGRIYTEVKNRPKYIIQDQKVTCSVTESANVKSLRSARVNN